MSELMLDVSQAHELKMAFRRAGYSNTEIKRLCEGSALADVRQVLLGHSAITPVVCVIDCEAAPLTPCDYLGGHPLMNLHRHEKSGQLNFPATQIEQMLLNATECSYTEGRLLNSDACARLNANVLDFFLLNQHLIPEKLKNKEVFFWNTRYCNPNSQYSIDDSQYIRCLFWGDDKWKSKYVWVWVNYY